MTSAALLRDTRKTEAPTIGAGNPEKYRLK
jgi:hypothetical protein